MKTVKAGGDGQEDIIVSIHGGAGGGFTIYVTQENVNSDRAYVVFSDLCRGMTALHCYHHLL